MLGSINRTLDPIQIKTQPATTDLMNGTTGIAVVGQGMIQAAEHNTATGQSLQRRQPETLGHSSAAPVLR